MCDKVIFLDTNILVYAYSTAEPEKREVARHLITSLLAWISVQVLNEYCNVARRKYPLLFERVSQTLDELADFLNIRELSFATTRQATRLSQKYGWSFYDSLIVAAALECQCSVLLTEDLQHGFVVDDRLRIKNPFVPCNII